MSKIAMGPCWSLRPSTSCFPGYAISSQTVSTTAPTCVTLSPNSASGPSRSSNAPLTLLAFNCCRAAGSSNEPWPGSIETAAWQRISKRRLRAPRRGSTSPLYSSSSGDWLDPYAMYLWYNTTIPIKIQTLRAPLPRYRFDCGAWSRSSPLKFYGKRRTEPPDHGRLRVGVWVRSGLRRRCPVCIRAAYPGKGADRFPGGPQGRGGVQGQGFATWLTRHSRKSGHDPRSSRGLGVIGYRVNLRRAELISSGGSAIILFGLASRELAPGPRSVFELH